MVVAAIPFRFKKVRLISALLLLVAALAIVVLLRSARSPTAESGGGVLPSWIASSPDGRHCAVLVASYYVGQPIPIYDKLWLAVDGSYRSLVDLGHPPWLVHDPVWDNTGERLAMG